MKQGYVIARTQARRGNPACAFVFFWIASLALAMTMGTARAETEIPRVLIALYDSREESSPRSTLIHRYLEMPANHLGFVLHYRDINAGLPPPSPEMAGAIVWFNPGMEVPDGPSYAEWLDAMTGAGKKLVILENAGLGDTWRKNAEIMDKAARAFARIGLRDTNRWQSLTYEAKLVRSNPSMTGFERAYETTLPPYMDTRATGEGVSHLKAIQGEGEGRTVSDLIVTSPGGGYAAANYGIYLLVENKEIRVHQWYMDPFLFLRLSLGADALPKPDYTTEAGMQLFYAQIDGDGWNDLSEIAEYRKRQATSAEAVLNEILRAYPDFGFGVGIIGTEIDPSCYGLPGSEETARQMLALNNVEAATHTMSHPLFWRFFAQYDAEKEKPYLSLYPQKPRERSSLVYGLFGGLIDRWQARVIPPQSYELPPPGRYDTSEEEALSRYYRIPRSYACHPFDLSEEIRDSAIRVQRLLPAGKRMQLLTWSGDTRPFPAALSMALSTGLTALGGGGARYDPEHPSYSSIPPVGLEMENTWQIYSANGNEAGPATSSDGSFGGASLFRQAYALSAHPWRLTPASLYFHMHAGRQPGTMTAIKDTLNWVRTREFVPVLPSDYTHIAEGFLSAKLVSEGTDIWRVHDRGSLSTLRFDFATLKSVNFNHSSGVIGQRWHQGSLYVALDSTVATPLIALKKNVEPGIYPNETISYLIQSSWRINRLQIANNSLTFSGKGYGELRMKWHMSAPGKYRLQALHEDVVLSETVAITAPDGLLDLSLPALSQGQPVNLRIEGVP